MLCPAHNSITIEGFAQAQTGILIYEIELDDLQSWLRAIEEQVPQSAHQFVMPLSGKMVT